MVVRAIACTGSEEINDSERDDGMEGSVETALPQDTAANGRIDHLLGCKYLTSSQVYSIQFTYTNTISWVHGTLPHLSVCMCPMCYIALSLGIA